MAGLTPFQQGIKLLSEGDAEAARHALFTLWASGGSDAANAARFIALIDKNERRFSDAIAILESSLEKFGREAATLAQLSEFYMTMGHHQKAIDAATQSLQEEPNLSLIHI